MGWPKRSKFPRGRLQWRFAIASCLRQTRLNIRTRISTMNKTRKTSNAVRILHRRYVGEDVQRKASLEQERVNAEVARTIYELREQAGLSQKELADRVDTTQSVISRLEDADYEGHSLSMLNRIAKALNQQVQVVMRPKEQKQASITLAVTKSVVREVNAGRAYQRQISIRGGSR